MKIFGGISWAPARPLSDCVLDLRAQFISPIFMIIEDHPSIRRQVFGYDTLDAIKWIGRSWCIGGADACKCFDICFYYGP